MKKEHCEYIDIDGNDLASDSNTDELHRRRTLVQHNKNEQ